MSLGWKIVSNSFIWHKSRGKIEHLVLCKSTRILFWILVKDDGQVHNAELAEPTEKEGFRSFREFRVMDLAKNDVINLQYLASVQFSMMFQKYISCFGTPIKDL